jgi:hypothetical protein
MTCFVYPLILPWVFTFSLFNIVGTKRQLRILEIDFPNKTAHTNYFLITNTMEMKYLIMTWFVFLMAAFSVHAQTPALTVYFEMKEALVVADAVSASGKGGEFSKAINGLDIKTIPADKQADFIGIRRKLLLDATQIAATGDLDKQRKDFASLSLNFYSLVKLVKLSDQPIYHAYCPMKKLYWLSNEKSIRNPYYGRMMLTCGSITETINP